MSWAPNDLVTDVDLQDYEAAILTQYGQTGWVPKRTKAIEDWLFPILKSRGFNPYRLRTRYEPDVVWGFTGSTYTNHTAASQDTTEDDLNLAALFATPGTDALYIGSRQPFRGVFYRILDSPSTATGAMTVSYWNGNWEAITITDGTIQVAGKTFSAGGSVTWVLPVDWAVRKVNSSVALYWVKVVVSAVPTAAKTTQVGVIRSSVLRAPTIYRTLQLIFQEAPTSGDGPWREKAEFYKDEADQALQRALGLVGGEFDTDESDQVSETESEQTAEEAGGSSWTLERA